MNGVNKKYAVDNVFPLHFLIFKKVNFGIVRNIINGLQSVNVVDGNEENLLHYSMRYYPYYELIKLLVKKKVCINAENKFGFTPLHLLIQDKQKNFKDYKNLELQLKIIKFLIKSGADANAGSKSVGTPLFFAMKFFEEIGKIGDNGIIERYKKIIDFLKTKTDVKKCCQLTSQGVHGFSLLKL